MDKPLENIARAGEIFIYCLWIEGQMSDLLILKKHPELKQEFIDNSNVVPSKFHEKRIFYWEKGFGGIKKEFEQEFNDLISNLDINDLEYISFIRNAIAHSHVSIARDYFLYRPNCKPDKEKEMMSLFNITPIVDESNPRVFKLEFWEDQNYIDMFNKIKRLDEQCFKVISESMNVPQSRIR